VETGYGYFGARYYDSELCIWLSIDPLSDKYPSLSPYTYCSNKPVKLVDPDGKGFITALCGSFAYAVGDIVSQTVSNGMVNLKNGNGFFSGWSKQMDWADVGISATAGAIDGFTLGASKGITSSISTLLKASVDLKGGNIKIVGGKYMGLKNNDKSLTDFIVDAGTGYISNGIGKALGLDVIGDDIDMGDGLNFLKNSTLIQSFKGLFSGIFNFPLQLGGDEIKSSINRYKNSRRENRNIHEINGNIPHISVGEISFIKYEF
jgi:hypothetical protein